MTEKELIIEAVQITIMAIAHGVCYSDSDLANERMEQYKKLFDRLTEEK